MNSASPAEIEPEPIETRAFGNRVGNAPQRNASARTANPIPDELCELCGCAIEDFEAVIYLRAADLVAQWERDDPRDNWKHTGEHPPRRQPPAPSPAYRTPQATVDAFKFVARQGDADTLAKWLADHPLDAPALLKDRS
jgi:hypothetical protein